MNSRLCRQVSRHLSLLFSLSSLLLSLSLSPLCFHFIHVLVVHPPEETTPKSRRRGKPGARVLVQQGACRDLLDTAGLDSGRPRKQPAQSLWLHPLDQLPLGIAHGHSCFVFVYALCACASSTPRLITTYLADLELPVTFAQYTMQYSTRTRAHRYLQVLTGVHRRAQVCTGAHYDLLTSLLHIRARCRVSLASSSVLIFLCFVDAYILVLSIAFLYYSAQSDSRHRTELVQRRIDSGRSL